MLRFKPLWKGVEVVRCFEAARCKVGVSAESKSLESSLVTGVEASDGGDTMVTDFLISELWRAPDGLRTRLEVFKEEGSEVVFARVGVGLTREELGALEVWLWTRGVLGWGLTETTWAGVAELWVLKGLIGLEWPLGPTPGLTRDRGSAELGVRRNMARLDTVGVILEVGVWDSLVGGELDFLVLGSVAGVNRVVLPELGVFEGS